MMNGFILVGLVIVVVGISYFWLHPPKPVCPECQAKKITKINESVESIRPYETGTSGMGGGGQLLQMEIKTTYRCHTCEHIWTETHSEA